MPEGRFLASDLHGNEWFFADRKGKPVEAYSLSAVDPDCQGPDAQPYCLLFQSTQRAAFDGASEVAFTWSALDTTDGSDREREDLIGHFAAVNMEDQSARWRVDWLDFSSWSGEAGCPYDPSDPCSLPASLTDAEYHACRLWMPHDLAVVGEAEEGVHFWAADTLNNRMLELDAPRDSGCAVVKTVIDAANPDWDVYASNNSLQYFVDTDGAEVLLFSAKQSTERYVGGGQLPGKGKGKILWWENRGEGWSQRWEFPPEVEGAESYVSNPHGVTTTLDASGRRLVMYAHSLGASDEWTENSGEGTIGVLVLGEDKEPAYVADLRLTDRAVMHFPRDVTPIDADRWLVVDSGCVGDICGVGTRGWVIPSVEGEPSGLGGTWSADHVDQRFVEPEVLAGPLLEEALQLYSVEWIAD